MLQGKFKLEIELGNDAMSEPDHIAAALAAVTDRILWQGIGGAATGIRDDNGDNVGSYAYVPADRARPTRQPRRGDYRSERDYIDAVTSWHHAERGRAEGYGEPRVPATRGRTARTMASIDEAEALVLRLTTAGFSAERRGPAVFTNAPLADLNRLAFLSKVGSR
jgi:hypothetical protein